MNCNEFHFQAIFVDHLVSVLWTIPSLNNRKETAKIGKRNDASKFRICLLHHPLDEIMPTRNSSSLTSSSYFLLKFKFVHLNLGKSIKASLWIQSMKNPVYPFSYFIFHSLTHFLARLFISHTTRKRYCEAFLSTLYTSATDGLTFALNRLSPTTASLCIMYKEICANFNH